MRSSISHTLLPLLPLALATNTITPIIVHTWGGPATVAADAAHEALLNSQSVLNAVQIGGTTCEDKQCRGTVGYGGSPAENCETTLDAMIMDGNTFNVGAVASLRRIKDAMAVARHVLEYTDHSLLAGDQATQFAVANGFKEESLTTKKSRQKCIDWKRKNCQPNSRVNVFPDPKQKCGPYKPSSKHGGFKTRSVDVDDAAEQGHDTISLIALDKRGNMAAGTTTNGKSHKIPGRVGDGPITGSGSYADSDVGGCGATGDGDIMMRFLPCYQAVENMRRGMSPAAAGEDAVKRIVKKFPRTRVGLVVMNNKGEHAGASSGWEYEYSYRGGNMTKTEVIVVKPIDGNNGKV